MKRIAFLLLFILPSFAFASNHTGIDQWGHFQAHFGQMLFWLSQGEWSLAFFQADCTQDALSKLLFVHGGVGVLFLAAVIFVAYLSRSQIIKVIRQLALPRLGNQLSLSAK